MIYERSSKNIVVFREKKQREIHFVYRIVKGKKVDKFSEVKKED